MTTTEQEGVMCLERMITRECITQALWTPEQRAKAILEGFEEGLAEFARNPGREFRMRVLVVDGMEAPR